MTPPHALGQPVREAAVHHLGAKERVGWTDTRNHATIRVERAARLMAATVRAARDLKRWPGAARGGWKLAKPVLHYSLSWARDETPTRQEVSRAVDESLQARGGKATRRWSSRTTTPAIPMST